MTKITQCRSDRLIIKKNQFEFAAWAHNGHIVGIDEVGRGCLAGPLVTAAVILPVNKAPRFIKDSKMLTLSERIKAYEWIEKNGWCGIGIVHNRFIDQHNIWQATLFAMKRALTHLLAVCPHDPETILVDAMPLDVADTGYAGIPVHYFPFGETKSTSIAAASIVAKVTRDNLMGDFEALFPGYALAQHKGYGTLVHKDALTALKSTIIHRQSFLKSHPGEYEDYDNQQTLF